MDEEGRIDVTEAGKPFTTKQRQYLAFTYYYTKIHGLPPVEADFQRFFGVTPPVVRQMIKTEDGPAELADQAAAIWQRRRRNVSLPRTFIEKFTPEWGWVAR